MKKTFLLIALLSLSVNSMAEDVGLKCDTDNANSSKPPATKLLIILERNKPRTEPHIPEVVCFDGILAIPCKEKVVLEFSILEGKWSQGAVIKENIITYQFYSSNSLYKASNMRESYTINRSDLSMISHEESCRELDINNNCTKYARIYTFDSYWQCKKYTAEGIREYAAEQLRDITQDNQI